MGNRLLICGQIQPEPEEAQILRSPLHIVSLSIICTSPGSAYVCAMTPVCRGHGLCRDRTHDNQPSTPDPSLLKKAEVRDSLILFSLQCGL